MSVLDNLPVASITFLVGIVLVVIGYIGDDISLADALESIGFVGVGAGVIGIARNQAGRGIKG